jgi:hypothetical protein
MHTHTGTLLSSHTLSTSPSHNTLQPAVTSHRPLNNHHTHTHTHTLSLSLSLLSLSLLATSDHGKLPACLGFLTHTLTTLIQVSLSLSHTHTLHTTLHYTHYTLQTTHYTHSHTLTHSLHTTHYTHSHTLTHTLQTTQNTHSHTHSHSLHTTHTTGDSRSLLIDPRRNHGKNSVIKNKKKYRRRQVSSH